MNDQHYKKIAKLRDLHINRKSDLIRFHVDTWGNVCEIASYCTMRPLYKHEMRFLNTIYKIVMITKDLSDENVLSHAFDLLIKRINPMVDAIELSWKIDSYTSNRTLVITVPLKITV